MDEQDDGQRLETTKPRISAGLLNEWCPNSESNQGHGDFQSPALPTELFGQRGALNLIHAVSSTLFLKIKSVCSTLRQLVGFALILAALSQASALQW